MDKNKILKNDFLKLIIPLIIIMLVDIFYVVLNGFTSGYSVDIGATFFEVIIIYSIFFIFWGVTKRYSVSTIIVCVMLLFVTIANQAKIAYTGEPVVLSDVLFLGAINETVGMINNTLFDTIKQYIPCMILLIILIIGVIFLAIKNEIIMNNKKHRMISVIIPVILLLILFIPTKVTKNVCLKTFFGESTRKDYKYFTYTKEYYTRYGLIGGLYGQFIESKIFEPDNYDEESLNETLKASKDNKLKEDKLNIGKPNIIMILSESFFDMSKLDEITFDKPLTPNYTKLKNEGLLFQMISPSYGGLTANVEMEVLTGINLAYYNNGYTPYLQLYKDGSKEAPSIVKELKKNGYTTSVTSCTTKDFYNRENVYTSMGFDERIYLNILKEEYRRGKYVSDEYLTDRIIEKLETKTHDEKIFDMTLTIQQHMPYTYDKYESYDIKITNSNLDESMEETVLAYAQGVYDADKELGRLYEYIQSYDEPTIIVFFGDHLPFLKTEEGKDVTKELDYFNTGDDIQDTYRKYNTEALILSNYDMYNENITYLGPDMLMPYVLSRLDLDNLSEYYIWLNEQKDVLPSYNKYILIDKQGILYNTLDINETMNTYYSLKEHMQYMMFMNNKD